MRNMWYGRKLFCNWALHIRCAFVGITHHVFYFKWQNINIITRYFSNIQMAIIVHLSFCISLCFLFHEYDFNLNNSYFRSMKVHLCWWWSWIVFNLACGCNNNHFAAFLSLSQLLYLLGSAFFFYISETMGNVYLYNPCVISLSLIMC